MSSDPHWTPPIYSNKNKALVLVFHDPDKCHYYLHLEEFDRWVYARPYHDISSDDEIARQRSNNLLMALILMAASMPFLIMIGVCYFWNPANPYIIPQIGVIGLPLLVFGVHFLMKEPVVPLLVPGDPPEIFPIPPHFTLSGPRAPPPLPPSSPPPVP